LGGTGFSFKNSSGFMQILDNVQKEKSKENRNSIQGVDPESKEKDSSLEKKS
jgi:hypothetical protein